MRVYKPKRKTTGGQRVSYQLWYVEVRVDDGRPRRLAGFTDRAATEQLGRRIEELVALCGAPPGTELSRYLERLPARIREKLVQWRLLDGRRFEGLLPLRESLGRFGEVLRERGRSEHHVRTTLSRVRAVLEGTGAETLSELTPERAEHYLFERTQPRARRRGLSARSRAAYLQAVRQFTGWLVKSGRASEDPLRSLRPPNPRTDRRRERRPLEPDEMRELLRAAETGPERFGIPGPDRALLYRMAVLTGLRANELRELRVFDLEGLDGDRPRVRVRAETAKSRREDVLPLQRDLAKQLRAAVAGKLPSAPVFRVPKKTAAMLREDLEAAGIEYEDASGRVVDFHALRGTFVSNLARSGVPPKVMQNLARHSTPELTFNVYAKLGEDAERDALDRLPTLDPPAPERVRATGTTGSQSGAGRSVAFCVASRGAFGCSDLQPDAGSRMLEAGAEVAEWQTRWIQNPFPARE